MGGRGEAGQASIEHIAIVVVVALLLAGLGAWALAQVRSDRTPPVLDVIAAPAVPAHGGAALPDLGVAPHRRDNRVLHGLRRAVRVVSKAPGIVRRGVRAYSGGFVDGIGSTVRGFVTDPVGSVIGGASVIPAVLRDPVGFTRAQTEAGAGYLRLLGTLPPEVVSEKVARDLGALSADIAIARGKTLAAKAAYRALRRRVGPQPPERAPYPPKVSR